MAEVMVFDSFEEMTDHIQQSKVRARDAMSDAQRILCDGNEHWALALESEGPEYPPILMVVHILSRNQFIAQQLKYVDANFWGEDCEQLDEACYPLDTYYGEGGCVSFGYLPAESWDSVYEIDEPDLHDRHASMLMEITEEDFNLFRSLRQDPAVARMVPRLRALLLRWIDEVAS